MKRTATWAILIFAFLGLADSAYLTQHELNGTPLLCNIGNLSGCNIVAQSPYSHIFGISLAEYGLLFYGVLFMIAAIELALYHHLARRVMQTLAALGFLASVYFVALQVFVINALCIYCMASAFLVLLIFIAAILLERVPKETITITLTPEESAPRPSYLSMPPSA